MKRFRLTRSLSCVALMTALAWPQFALAQGPGTTVRDRIEQSAAMEHPDGAGFDEAVAAYDAGDYKKAFDIWLPLAQRDDLAAMRNVALMLRHGKGVERDPERALYFYERSGRAGLVAAQVNSAFMHLDGDGIPQDYKKASFWFHAAAMAGVPVARYNLGVMYERGLGVEADPARALAWYALAARAGHAQALDRLTVLVPYLPGPMPPTDADAALVVTAPAPPEAQLDRLDVGTAP
ncbi:MAG: tetratricopeptide repeat protein [Parvibaculum sp.]|nr:tetratricopeptide repeat protein [Parvibaculum sp.]